MNRNALLRAGAAAGPLFVTAFLLDGATRADYDPRRHPVSSLSLGPRGWRQRADFAVAGSLLLAGAVGLGRRGRLVGAAAVGLLGAGAFVTDPISGYPPGTPMVAERKSPTGAAHDLFGVPVFLGIPAAAFVEARRGSGWWRLASAAAGAGMLAFFGLAGAGFAQQPTLTRYAGVLQRISLGIGLGWVTALMVRARRS
jgi:Protein of unknown function (DUF998)